MSKRKKQTQFASTEAEDPAERRWTRERLIWVGIAIAAAAGSVVFGLVAMDEAGFRAARVAFEDEKYRIAKIELEHFLQDRPKHAEAQVLYARTLVQLNEKPELALQIFEKYRAATPDEMHSWARAHFLLQRWSAGVPLVAQVVKAQPNNHEALREWVAALLRLRQYEKARKPAEQYLAKSGNVAMGHLFLGTIDHSVDDSQKAEQHLAKVLEHAPTGEGLQVSPADFFAFYAEVLLINGKAEEAHKYAERSVSFERNPLAFLVLGEALQQLGDELNAKAAFNECILMEPGNVEARSRMAEAYLTDGNAADALKWIAPVYSGPQINSEIAYLVERCYRRLNDDEKIAEWSEKRKALQLREERLAKVQHWAIEYPTSFEAMMYRVWQFASEGNWPEASTILGSLTGNQDRYDSEFGAQLVRAVDARDPEMIPSIYDFEFRPQAPGEGQPGEGEDSASEDNGAGKDYGAGEDKGASKDADAAGDPPSGSPKPNKDDQ